MKRRVTLDASVALRWSLPDETDRAGALQLRESLLRGELDPIEPVHFLLEVAAGLVRAHRAGRLPADDCREALRALEAIAVDTTDASTAATDALQLALIGGLRVADAAYAVCAKRASTTLVTADQRLARVATAAGIAVVALSDLPPW
jgi:predicted nucleic acid-binding protein